jgi:hypothetical protein
MPFEGGLDDAALNPAPAAVNDPHFGEARLRCCDQVFLDY